MPALISLLLREQIRLFKPLFTKFSVSDSRAFQEALGDLGAKVVSDSVRFTDFEIGDVPACAATPIALANNDRRALLYLHGGGYVAGSLGYARGFAGTLADAVGIRTLCIGYRLAPEHPFPAALEDAFAAYEYLLSQGCRADDISLIGESAGGGLILALCLKLKAMGMPLPSRLIPLSPWTDLTLSGKSYETNLKADISLTHAEIDGFVEAYAPPDTRDPLVSPLFGDFAGFPPCFIFVGGDELLLSDSVMLADRLRAAGVNCSLTVEDGMWHGYVLYGVPEAVTALAEIKKFLEE
ncbi:MAG: alpha/beta hydrolase [Oscillospiraceae bacterium]